MLENRINNFYNPGNSFHNRSFLSISCKLDIFYAKDPFFSLVAPVILKKIKDPLEADILLKDYFLQFEALYRKSNPFFAVNFFEYLTETLLEKKISKNQYPNFVHIAHSVFNILSRVILPKKICKPSEEIYPYIKPDSYLSDFDFTEKDCATLEKCIEAPRGESFNPTQLSTVADCIEHFAVVRYRIMKANKSSLN